MYCFGLVLCAGAEPPEPELPPEKTVSVAPTVGTESGVSSAADEDGWIPLFNGKDLEGWTYKQTGSEVAEDPDQVVSVRDGHLVFDYADFGRFNGRFGHLFHEIPHTHYRVRVVYRFVGEQAAGGPGWAFKNSGVMVHAQDPATMRRDQEFPVSIEVQLLGGYDNRRTHRPTANLCTPGTNVEMDGELVTMHCTRSASGTHRLDKWVTVEIEVNGDQEIVHRVGGKEVMRYQRPQLDPSDPDAKAIMQRRNGELALERGWIALQGESHPVEYRSVEMKVSSPPEDVQGD